MKKIILLVTLLVIASGVKASLYYAKNGNATFIQGIDQVDFVSQSMILPKSSQPPILSLDSVVLCKVTYTPGDKEDKIIILGMVKTNAQENWNISILNEPGNYFVIRKVYYYKYGYHDGMFLKILSFNESHEATYKIYRPDITPNDLTISVNTPFNLYGNITYEGLSSKFTQQYKWLKSTDQINWQLIATTKDLINISIDKTSFYKRETALFIIAGNLVQIHSSCSNIVTVTETINGGQTSSNQTICAGEVIQPVTCTPATGGSYSGFTYQWQSSANNTDWSDISGQTGQDISIGVVNNQMYLRRKCINNSVIGYSNVCIIWVRSPLVASLIGDNQTIYYGETPQPFKELTPPSGGVEGNYLTSWEVASLINPTLFVSNNVSGNSYINGIQQPAITNYQSSRLYETKWFRRNDNSCATDLKSNAVKITVFPQLVGGTITGDQSNIISGTVGNVCSNSILGSGGNQNLGYTYQWQYIRSNTDPTSFPEQAWTNITGAINESYQPVEILNFNTYYRRKVKNFNYYAVSNNIKKTVLAPLQTPNVSTTAGGVSSPWKMCYKGGMPSISCDVATGGTGVYSYQWQQSLDNGASWSDIPTSEGRLQYISPSGLTQTTRFRRKVKDSSGVEVITTNYYEVQVYPEYKAGEITTSNLSLCGENSNTIFSELTPPTGGATSSLQTYTWQISTDGINFFMPTLINTGGSVPTTKNLTWIDPFSLSKVWIKRIDSKGCGSLSTNTLALSVAPFVSAGTLYPVEGILTGTQPALITGIPSSGGKANSNSCQWQKTLTPSTESSWQNILGATGETYQPPILTQTTSYRKVVTNSGCGSAVISNPITIEVYSYLNPSILIAIKKGNKIYNPSVCKDYVTDITLSGAVAMGGSGGFTYTWEKKDAINTSWTQIYYTYGPNIGLPVTTLDYVTDPISSTTTYRRVAHNATLGAAFTPDYTIKVYSDITASTIGESQDVYKGDSPDLLTTITLSTQGDGSYLNVWKYSTDNTNFINIGLPSSESLTFQPPSLTQTTWYRKEDSSCGLSVPSINTIKMTVFPALIAGLINGNETVCNSTQPTIALQGTLPLNGVPSKGYTYQWQTTTAPTIESSWSDIFNAVDLNCTVDKLGVLTQTTYYRRKDINGLHYVVTNYVTKMVLPALVGGDITSPDQAICNNRTASIINATPATGGNISGSTYQWLSSIDGANYTNIPTATNQNYLPTELFTTSKYFKRKAINTCGTVESNFSLIVVGTKFMPGVVYATTSPICYGTVPPEIIEQTPTTGGLGVVKYQWRYSYDGLTYANIQGAVSKTYQPESLIQTVYYKRVDSNDCDSQETNAVVIAVNPPYLIGSIEAPESTCFNSNVTITGSLPSGGSGASSTFKWESSIDGITFNIIANATAKDYTTKNLTTTTYFRRQDNNLCAKMYTNIVMIYVKPQLIGGDITSLPETICNNQNASEILASPASGGSEVESLYQWETSFTGVNYAIIGGAVDQNYLPTTALTASTYFRRRTINECATSVSKALKVTVANAFVPGVIQGIILPICNGTIPSPIVEKSPVTGGLGVVNYQWRYSLDGTIFSDIQGATSKEFQPLALTQTTYYKRVDSNNCDSQETNIVTITVNPIYQVGAIQAPESTCFNTTVVIDGTPAIGGNGTNSNYVWESSIDGINFTTILSSNTVSLTTNKLTVTKYFRRKDINSCGTGYTNTVMIVVNLIFDAGNITSLDQEICNGVDGNTILTSATTGGLSNNTQYQWESSDLAGTSWTNIVGAVEQNYLPKNVSSSILIRRKTTNECGLSTSKILTLTVKAPLIHSIIQGQNVTICNGTVPAQIIETVPTTGGSTIANLYQWQSSLDDFTYENIQGATTKNFQPSPLTTSTYFKRVDTNYCGQVNSNPVQIVVNPVFNAGTIKDNQIIPYQTAFTTIVGTEALGSSSSTYQWLRSFDNINWLNMSDNAVNYNSQIAIQTMYFQRKAANNCGSGLSNVINITVLPQPVIGKLTTKDHSVCYNSPSNPLICEASTGGDGIFNSLWYQSEDAINWISIRNSNSLNFTSSPLLKNTYFKRVDVGLGGTVETSPILVTVKSTVPVPVIKPLNKFCLNSNGLISISNPTQTYLWYNANYTKLSEGNSLSLNNITTANTYFVQSKKEDGCLSDYTQIDVTIDNVKANFEKDLSTVDIGSAIHFTNTSENASSFIWNFFDGDLITETSPTHYYNYAGKKRGEGKSFDVKLYAKSVNNCIDSITVLNAVYVVPGTSLETLEANAIKVYPNPVVNILNVVTQDEPVIVRIFTALGEHIYKSIDYSTTHRINMSSYSTGLYLVTITDRLNNSITYKINK